MLLLALACTTCIVNGNELGRLGRPVGAGGINGPGGLAAGERIRRDLQADFEAGMYCIVIFYKQTLLFNLNSR